MKRVLVSQNENNNGTDYLIVNGKVLNDRNEVAYYGRVFSNTDGWKVLHAEDFLEIRQNENRLLIKSFYNEKDTINSIIYYMYLIEESDNIELILDYLEKDSQLIGRTFDEECVERVLKEIKNNKKLKKKIITQIAIVGGILLALYLITRIK